MEHVDVMVVGAGLAGLTAARSAAGEGATVAVVEVHGPGGRAATTRRDDGVAWNQGAHALYRGGPAWRVLASLGITPTGGAPLTAGAHMLRGGELFRAPLGAAALVRTRLLGLRGRAQVARLLGRLGRIDDESVRGRSLDQWLDDLGLADDARGFVAAMARVATYTADHARLPAEVALGQLRLAAQGVLYLDDGFGQLVGALAGAAAGRGAAVVDHDPVAAIAPSAGGWTVETAGGRAWAARTVVLAAGGPSAASALLPERPTAWADLGPDVVAACLAVAARRVPDPPIVFGIDEPLYLSTHCPPARLAPDGMTVVELLRYRPTGEAGDPTVDRARFDTLLAQASIGADDVLARRYLHRMTVLHAVPDPAVGLAGRAPVAVDGAAGLFVAGDWVGPTGWLADASVASGEAAGLLAAAAARAVLAR